MLEPVGQDLDGLLLFDDPLHLPGDLLQGVDQLPPLQDAHVLEPRQPDGEHRQRHDLAGEGLGARHPDLGAGVQVGPAVDLAGDRRADHVDETDRPRPPLLGLPDGGQGVGGLAALGDPDHQRALVDHRIPVPELGGVFHFDRDPRQLLDEVLTDEAGMPTGAARGDDDPLELLELLVAQVEAIHARGPLLFQEMAPHRVLDGLRLLEDLLEHEVFVPAPFDGGEVPLDLAHRLADARQLEVADAIPLAGQHGHLPVVQVHHRAGVGQDGRGIGGDEPLAVPDAEQQRRSLPRRHQDVGFVRGDHRQAIRPLDLPERRRHCFGEVI